MKAALILYGIATLLACSCVLTRAARFIWREWRDEREWKRLQAIRRELES